MNWYIGQEVVCVAPNELLIKGKVYTIYAVKKGGCACSEVEIDVGICKENYSAKPFTRCTLCNALYPTEGPANFFMQERFAPLQTASEEADMNEAIQESIERIFQ